MNYSEELFQQWIKNEEFKYEIISYTIPFIRRVTGILLTLFKSYKKDHDSFDMDQFGSDFNEFDTYSQFFNSLDPELKVLEYQIDGKAIQ